MNRYVVPRIKRREFLRYAGAIGSAVVTSTLGFPIRAFSQQRTLVVNSYGGAFEKFMRGEIIPGFEKECHCQINLAVGLAKEWLATLRAAGVDNPPYDVMMTNEIWASLERREGFFIPLPLEKVPNLQEVHPHFRNKDDNGVLGIIMPIGLAYREDLVQKPPTSWKDLWENPEFQGKIGLYTITNSAGMMFLMLIAKIYGDSQYNIDAGFEAIQKLKPFKQVDFSGTLETQLERGEVLIGPLDAPAVARLRKRGVKIAFAAPKEGLFMFEQDFNVLKGSKNKDLAFAYINYQLSRPVQEKWVKEFFITPANKQVEIPPDLQDDIPIVGEKVKEILVWDWDAFNDKRQEIIERWNKEISR
jgi:putative spermidine/putrescine transport system substrate-binding protein